jgi:hypothetical protein
LSRFIRLDPLKLYCIKTSWIFLRFSWFSLFPFMFLMMFIFSYIIYCNHRRLIFKPTDCFKTSFFIIGSAIKPMFLWVKMHYFSRYYVNALRWLVGSVRSSIRSLTIFSSSLTFSLSISLNDYYMFRFFYSISIRFTI